MQHRIWTVHDRTKYAIYFNSFDNLLSKFKDWKKGFSFKSQSVKEHLEFKRTKVIDSIEKRIDDWRAALIVGPGGYSKTTFFLWDYVWLLWQRLRDTLQWEKKHNKRWAWIAKIHRRTAKFKGNQIERIVIIFVDRQALMRGMQTYHSIGRIASRVVIKGCCNLVGGKLMSSFLADSTTQSAL